jgi:hypothetical protein
MKRVILFCFTVAIFSCKKEEERSFQNNGVITGTDMRGCISVDTCPRVCGGFLFHFTDTIYSDNIPIDNPQIFNFSSNTKFPVYLRIDWQNTTRCGVFAIKIINYKIL